MSMTSPQLAAQRANKRWKQYFLAVSNPSVVYTARINGTFASYDGVWNIPFDTGSGTLSNIKPGMTCFVGSTAGAYDRGIVRVMETPTATPLAIGSTSGIYYQDNDYLTIIEDFPLFNKPTDTTGGTTVIDSRTPFSAVNSFAPIVRAGPAALVLERTAGTVSHSPTITTYSPQGLSMASYQHYAPGASSSSGMTTNNPTITYTVAGEYYERFTATDSAGGVGYCTRKIFVDPATTAKFDLTSITTDESAGGVSVQVSGYSGVDLASLRDGALVVLWKHDFVGTSRDTSYGPYAGAENQRLWGWIAPQTLKINPLYGEAQFTIQGPSWWLGKLPGSPMSLTTTSGAPANWDQMQNMTVDKALYRLVKWQSTLAEICDVNFSGSTVAIKTAIANSGTARDQIQTIANDKLLANILFDRFGCAWIQTPVYALTATPRAAVDVLQDFTNGDWINFDPGERRTVSPSAMDEISGYVYSGGVETQIWSRAPGNTANTYGIISSPYSRLAVASQAQLNQISGDVLAHDAITYPSIDVTTGWAHDFIDIAPLEILRISVAAGQNPRGLTWTNKHIVPLAITWNFNKDTGEEGTDITFEEETDGADGVTYVPPVGPIYVPPPLPTITPFPFPIPGLGGPPIYPPPPAGTCTDVPNGPFTLAWDVTSLNPVSASVKSKTYYPCKIRANSDSNTTLLAIPVHWDTTSSIAASASQAAFHVYAIDATGNPILTGTVTHFGVSLGDPTLVTFLPASDTIVAGFMIVEDAAAIPSTTLPLYQGARGDADGWDVVITDQAFGHTIISDTSARTLYDSAGGHCAYSCNISFVGLNGFASGVGLSFNFIANWSAHTYGSNGTLWAYINWRSLTSNPTYPATSIYQDATLFVYQTIGTGSTFLGWYQAINGSRSISYTAPVNLHIITTGETSISPNITYTDTMDIDIYYAPDTFVPYYPHIQISNAQLWNVCGVA